MQHQPGRALGQAYLFPFARRTSLATHRPIIDIAAPTMTSTDAYEEKGNVHEVEDYVSVRCQRDAAEERHADLDLVAPQGAYGRRDQSRHWR